MNYQEIPPFYEYPHVRGEPCDCQDCLELSIMNAIDKAAEKRPKGTIRVKLRYIGRSKPEPLYLDDCDCEGCKA